MNESPPLAVTVGTVAAIGALTVATIWGLATTNAPAVPLAVDIAAGVAACALMPVMLRWPVPGALALAVLAAVSPAATPASGTATLHVAGVRPFRVAARVGAAAIAAHLIRGLWRPSESLPFVWWLVLVVATGAALVGWGQWTQARRALVDSLRERAERAEAEQARHVAEARAAERTRIAREMHDVLAHRLSLLATYAGALEYRPDAPAEQLARAAGVIRSGVHQALDELREVISVLRADELSDGRHPAPGLSDLDALVTESRDAGTRVDVETRVRAPEDLPGTAGRTAYRVVQEGLTNARKHAPGAPVRLVLDGQPGGLLTVELSNRTRPDEPWPAINGSGTGLIGLTERVRLAGGELDHAVGTGGEFRLRARIPWPAS
ncbi:MAG TPA: histidine kinase [Trebonia sp.]|nr:histidine kinase [Trebonia sp.]